MKYPVIVVPFLKVAGMAVFPFILVNNKCLVTDALILNHERIHLKQQAELLVVPFYLLYLLNYFINLARYLKHDKAYRSIVFEREAYAKEADMSYLQYRKAFGWYRYFKH